MTRDGQRLNVKEDAPVVVCMSLADEQSGKPLFV